MQLHWCLTCSKPKPDDDSDGKGDERESHFTSFSCDRCGSRFHDVGDCPMPLTYKRPEFDKLSSPLYVATTDQEAGEDCIRNIVTFKEIDEVDSTGSVATPPIVPPAAIEASEDGSAFDPAIETSDAAIETFELQVDESSDAPVHVDDPGDTVPSNMASEPTTIAPISPVPRDRGPLGVVAGIRKGSHEVKVWLQGQWKVAKDDEVEQICTNLEAGNIKFTISARSAKYDFDFTNLREPTQTSCSTGKVRRMRVVRVRKTTRSYSTVSSIDFEALQAKYGPQSKRGEAPQHQLEVLQGNENALARFADFAAREERMCADWGVFYHAYSKSALLYELNAAVGAVLFRFRSQYATLPRILVHNFMQTPDADTLIEQYYSKFKAHKKDHHPEFRNVAISAMCSLVALGPEASTPVVFLAGYSERDLSFHGVLEGVLASCYVPKGKIKKLAKDIIQLSEKHGLDVTEFGGKGCESGKAGHLLQIFVRRDLVDQLSYASLPYGAVDKDRHPISEWLDADSNCNMGQARILAHPAFFMQASCVRMYVGSADPVFHTNRHKFQSELTELLAVVLADRTDRKKAAKGIFGGSLPDWWTDADQREFRAQSRSLP